MANKTIYVSKEYEKYFDYVQSKGASLSKVIGKALKEYVEKELTTNDKNVH